MYLLRERWSKRETLLFALAVTAPEWLLLCGLLFLAQGNPLALEMGVLLSGMLAIAFALLATAATFAASRLIAPAPSWFRILRYVLLLALLVSPLNILLVHFFPANLLAAAGMQAAILYRKLPGLQQELEEESLRIETAALLTVCLKITTVAAFLSLALL